MITQPFHIFTKSGDALTELDAVLKQFGTSDADQAGYAKSIYVTRADQTVVFVTDRDAPLARALRERTGWQEPEP